MDLWGIFPLCLTFKYLLTETYLNLINIYNDAFLDKIFDDFKLLTVFAKKAPSKMFDNIENMLLAKGLKYWVYYCSQSEN